jgi:4-hydroxy-tetrahydrodipicolinate reductase
MKQITVAVHGALGKVGREIIAGIPRNPDLSLVAGVDNQAKTDCIPVPGTTIIVPLYKDLDSLLQKNCPQVIVDFSIYEAAVSAARQALSKGVHMVIGTTGISAQELSELDKLAKASNAGAVVAANFALGAAVLMHLAGIAARFFDHAEIIELHHNQKADAPSGTSLATATGMIKSRGKPFIHNMTKKENLAGTRGGQVEGITIHSVRLPGLVASEEVIFGGEGQTLTLRHDTINRECYLPGVVIAVRKVVNIRGLVFGLEHLLDLGGNNETV